jgi:rubrerythrin
MNNKMDLVEKLEKHRQLELDNIKICQEREKQLKNPAAQLMLYQIRMDSTKHAHILQKLKEIIEEDIPEPVWSYRADRYIGQVRTEEELKKHAELEKEMIRAHEDTIKSSNDPGINMILQHIVEDEKRHHKIIMEMINNLLHLGS